jgi:hypothetical protein
MTVFRVYLDIKFIDLHIVKFSSIAVDIKLLGPPGFEVNKFQTRSGGLLGAHEAA